jgi:O-antigen/teichoic acid export membrane protein
VLKLNNNVLGINRKSLIAISLSLFCYVVTYLINIVGSHILGVHLYGVYSSIVFSLGILANFCFLGFDDALLKYLPNYLRDKNWQLVAGYLGLFIKRILSVNVVFIVGAIIAIIIIQQHEQIALTGHYGWILFLWVIPFIASVIFLGNYLEAIGKNNTALFVETTLQPLLLLLLIAGLWLFHQQITLLKFLIVFAVANVLAVIISFTMIFKNMIHILIKHRPQYANLVWTKSSVQLFFLNISSEYLGSIVIITSAWFSKNNSDPGLLTAIIIICALFWAVNDGAKMLLTPEISIATTNNSSPSLRRLLWRSLLLNAIPMLIFLVLIFCYGKVWLTHFGLDYQQGYYGLLIIGTAVIFNIICTPVLWILEYSKDLSKTMYSSILSFILVVVGSAVFASYWGLLGSALIYAVARVVGPIYWLFLLFKHRYLTNKT